mmetsp:Transcript_26665/g.62640  ORF Transcript_26665/g.62640 Transcript_26665/m.62640 type:complete len:80 (-) Transcript_26665:1371-1610(-)
MPSPTVHEKPPPSRASNLQMTGTKSNRKLSFSLFAISYGTRETDSITRIISADDRCRKQEDTSASPVGCKLFCPFSPAS